MKEIQYLGTKKSLNKNLNLQKIPDDLENYINPLIIFEKKSRC